MHNVHKMLRNRTMSMEDYDKPLKERNNSLSAAGSPPTTPLDHGTMAPPTLTLSSPSNDLPTEPLLIEGN